jgi:hypothetical protein
MKYSLAAALILAIPSAAFGQGPSGKNFSNPGWGQYGGTAWGTYSGAIGQDGWNYHSQLRPNEPVGSVLADPNALNSNFANPRTGATLYQPQDTRLKGRDRP